MTTFVNVHGLVDETPCTGCGWPKSSCLCPDDEATNPTLDEFMALIADNPDAWYRFGPGETQNYFEALKDRHQQAVVDAVHQGIAGATRAWREKVDEACLLRDVAIIERDEALAEAHRLAAALTAANNTLHTLADGGL